MIISEYHFNNVLSREVTSAYDTIKEHVEKQLRRNSYSIVNLDKISAKAVAKGGGFQMRLEEEWSDFEDDEDDYTKNPSQYLTQSVRILN